jgi:hypothetical protein
MANRLIKKSARIPRAKRGLPEGTAVQRDGSPRRKRTATAEDVWVTTLRLRPEIREGLELLQGALGVTMNKLMNDGLAEYVTTRTAVLEADLQTALGRIRRYRQQDPTFSESFAQIAGEEAERPDADPVEGVAYRTEAAGPAVSMVRNLIAESH